jgi:D-tagatose-1,6-bisphosphate aldolase subunit GatZ/KbaZ
VKAFLDLVRAHRAGSPVGITSVCSAHPAVIETALREAMLRGSEVLLEATSNQVNQFGGYTGRTPAQFRDFAYGIARELGFDPGRLFLGGDHLGPNPWQVRPAGEAMALAGAMVAGYVRAGFRKIHLDCSMSCAGDPHPLEDATVAARAACLARVAEDAWCEEGGEPPVYVVGTEVPVPGGAAGDLEPIRVTSAQGARATIAAHREAFARRGLEDAWNRVVALVVQPGVEFDHHRVVDFDPQAARGLGAALESEPGLVFEAHSTDYQRPAMLRELVVGHFAILKVGPALTFALREAYWALAAIARELRGEDAGRLPDAVLAAMQADPRHWSTYYTDAARRRIDLQFSRSDRIRYYWGDPAVQAACAKLLSELGPGPLPLTLVSQFLPIHYAAVREGTLANEPQALLFESIARVLRAYADACSASGRAASTA